MNSIDLDNNFIRLSDNDHYYWGEIPYDVMTKVLSLSRKQGWKAAVHDVVLKRYPDLQSMILGEDRVDWLNWIKQENMLILDVGSGWGQTSFLMTRNKSNYVVSLEQIRERALFQHVRKEQDDVDNICIVNGSLFDVRFVEGIFDLVLFIGVLEWVGVGGEPKKPRDIQISALRRAREFLKDEGLLCIGIENRTGFNNFLGALDHSGLRFTSIMPRPLANAYVKMRAHSFRSNKTPTSYRTYTYTAKGYKELLTEAGFREVLVLIAHPHYAHPQCLLEMDNRLIREFFTRIYKPRSIKDFVISNLFRIVSIVKLGESLAPHFIIFAKK
jgi:ubiquinone/menaquinone biosynthesis C-methylase UbiE